MVNIYKHVSTCLLLFVITLHSPFVFAIGLGELRIQSYLNQPLEAQIPILDLKGIDPNDIVVSLADRATYAKENLEVTGWINHIQFNVIKDQNKKVLIRLSTQQPIKEPYGDLLIQVAWPTGKLVREYALLLDPPPLNKKTLFTQQLVSQKQAKEKPKPDINTQDYNKRPNKLLNLEEPQKPLKLVSPLEENAKTNKSLHSKERVTPENVVQRLTLIEESLDTLKRTNEAITQKNQQLQSQNETLAGMLAAKDAEIIRLKQTLEKSPQVAQSALHQEQMNSLKPAQMSPENHIIAVADPTLVKKEAPSRSLISQDAKKDIKKTKETKESKESKKDVAFILFMLAFLFSLVAWIWYSREHIKNLLIKLAHFMNHTARQTSQNDLTSHKVLDLPGFGVQIDLEKVLGAINTQGKGQIKERSDFDLSEAESEAQKKSQTLLHDAQIYIAYERYQQAEAILKEILTKEKIKDLYYWEAYLKLLELYVLTEKYEEFQKWYPVSPSEDIPSKIMSKINILQDKVQSEMTIHPNELEIKQNDLEKILVTQEISAPLEVEEQHNISPKLALVKEDEIQTKISRAKAYIEVGDNLSAKQLLEKILPQAQAEQKEEIQKLLFEIKPVT